MTTSPGRLGLPGRPDFRHGSDGRGSCAARPAQYPPHPGRRPVGGVAGPLPGDLPPPGRERTPAMRRGPGLAAALVLACGLFSPAARAADRPNIIVVLADDLGAGDLSCCGGKLAQTRNLDRLA